MKVVDLQLYLEMELENVDSATEVTEDSPKNVPKPDIKLPGRRVNFPDDDELVSAAVDPQDPWNAARDTSTEDLVEAYKDGCVKWNVKPIPRLLQQLYAIHDFKTRADLLNLKGERLDFRQCEALEDVFKRVQFKVIDLENTNLEDESTTALVDMFEFYESAEKLILASNRSIGPRGWQATARYLKKTDSLECLDARNCTVTDLSMPVLARSLRVGSTVTALHLENCNLAGRSLFVLASSLKFNQTLKDLFLADNRLMPSDAIQIATMLKFNWSLKLIDLRNNHIQNVGLAHICDGLVEQKDDGLSTLVLWNNGITHVAMNELGRALGDCHFLDTLNLGHNTLTNEGVLVLKDGLLKNSSILRLGLVNTKITCEGAIALAEYLADSSRVLRIDIRENEIRTGGLMALTLSLKVNRSLLRLDIDVKKEPELEELQKTLQDEMSNYCKRNREIAKDENFKRQVIEAQKAVERKTLHRSHEDIHAGHDGKGGAAQASGDSPAVASSGSGGEDESVATDAAAAAGDGTKESVGSQGDGSLAASAQHAARRETPQEPVGSGEAGALAINSTDAPTPGSKLESSSLVSANARAAGLPHEPGVAETGPSHADSGGISQSPAAHQESGMSPGTGSVSDDARQGDVASTDDNPAVVNQTKADASASSSPNETKSDQTAAGVPRSEHIDSAISQRQATVDRLARGDSDNSNGSRAIPHTGISSDAPVPNGLLQEFKGNEPGGSLILETGKAQKTVSDEDLPGLDEFEQELNDMVASVTAASLDEVTQLAHTTSLEDEDIFDN